MADGAEDEGWVENPSLPRVSSTKGQHSRDAGGEGAPTSRKRGREVPLRPGDEEYDPDADDPDSDPGEDFDTDEKGKGDSSGGRASKKGKPADDDDFFEDSGALTFQTRAARVMFGVITTQANEMCVHVKKPQTICATPSLDIEVPIQGDKGQVLDAICEVAGKKTDPLFLQFSDPSKVELLLVSSSLVNISKKGTAADSLRNRVTELKDGFKLSPLVQVLLPRIEFSSASTLRIPGLWVAESPQPFHLKSQVGALQRVRPETFFTVLTRAIGSAQLFWNSRK